MPLGSSMQQQPNLWLKGTLFEVKRFCFKCFLCFCFFFTGPFSNRAIRIIRRGGCWPRQVSHTNSGSQRNTSLLLHVWQSWRRNFRWLGQFLPRCADTAREFETQRCCFFLRFFSGFQYCVVAMCFFLVLWWSLLHFREICSLQRCLTPIYELGPNQYCWGLFVFFGGIE